MGHQWFGTEVCHSAFCKSGSSDPVWKNVANLEGMSGHRLVQAPDLGKPVQTKCLWGLSTSTYEVSIARGPFFGDTIECVLCFSGDSSYFNMVLFTQFSIICTCTAALTDPWSPPDAHVCAPRGPGPQSPPNFHLPSQPPSQISSST